MYLLKGNPSSCALHITRLPPRMCPWQGPADTEVHPKNLGPNRCLWAQIWPCLPYLACTIGSSEASPHSCRPNSSLGSYHWPIPLDLPPASPSSSQIPSPPSIAMHAPMGRLCSTESTYWQVGSPQLPAHPQLTQDLVFPFSPNYYTGICSWPS